MTPPPKGTLTFSSDMVRNIDIADVYYDVDLQMPHQRVKIFYLGTVLACLIIPNVCWNVFTDVNMDYKRNKVRISI